MTDTTVICFLAEIDRVYGGSEEGGWWYDVGEPVNPSEAAELGLAVKVFASIQEAREFVDSPAVHELLDELNEDRPPIHSVNSQGQYIYTWIKDEWPRPWPSVTPHYE